MNRLKEAFDTVKVREKLKSDTLSSIYERRKVSYKPVLAMAFVLLLMLSVGGVLYMTPVSSISVDINPSLELGVNRFDRVISAKAYNQDGEKLLKEVNVLFKKYDDALLEIVECDYINEFLNNNEVLDISVVNDESGVMLQRIRDCVGHHDGVHCHGINGDDNAHKHGLSYGKYNAYMELKEKYGDIDIEDIRDLSMREIHELEAHHGH